MARRKETSKKTRKRSKRQKTLVGTHIALPDEEVDESWMEGLDASPPSPIASPNEALDSTHNEQPRRIMKKRGKTKLKGFGIDQHEPEEVEFNERGQPIGDTSVTLSSFIGALVRATVLVNEDDWRKVSKQLKDDLWTAVVQRYKLEDIDKAGILKKMGNVLREHRSRIATNVRKACALEQEESHTQLAKLKPDNLTDHEWKDFIKNACSVKARYKSNLMKLVRENHTQPHTMSRLGYARLEEKLKKKDPTRAITRVHLWTEGHLNKDHQPANTSVAESLRKIQDFNESRCSNQTSSVKDDALTNILGKDRPGRMTGLGFGVTITKLTAQAHCNKRLHTLENKVNKMEAKFDKLLEERERSEPEGVDSTRVATPKSNHASNNLACNSDLQEPTIGQKCKLMSWYVRGEIVAEGTIASTDPSSQVHHIPLGFDAWKIWVDIAVNRKAYLWRTTSDLRLIEHAVGTTIAWNKAFITLDN